MILVSNFVRLNLICDDVNKFDSPNTDTNDDRALSSLIHSKEKKKHIIYNVARKKYFSLLIWPSCPKGRSPLV